MIKRGARCPSTVCLFQFSALTFIYYRTRREVKPGEQFLSILTARWTRNPLFLWTVDCLDGRFVV